VGPVNLSAPPGAPV